MDTPTAESNALDVNSAAEAFSSLFDEKKEAAEETPEVDTELDTKSSADPEEVDTPETEASEADEPKTFTIKVDGKDVEVSEAELAEAYKSGLRQADYTKKTMEVAEQRKAAEAEIAKAHQERETYARNLTEQSVLLHAALTEQNQINWQQLLESDPIEYLKQRDLYDQRQRALTNAQEQYRQLEQLEQAERAKSLSKFVQTQQEELLAKLPDWKDENKAQAEKIAMRTWLNEQGYGEDEINTLTDHRSVLVARKAMLYDQMMQKAKAAAKKVEKLPAKVERPGVTETKQGMDKRSAAFQRLSKSGSVDDAAALFSSIL